MQIFLHFANISWFLREGIFFYKCRNHLDRIFWWLRCRILRLDMWCILLVVLLFHFFFFITFLDTHCIHTQNDHELQEIIIVVSIVVGCEVSKIMMTLNERKRIRWGEGGSRILNLRACLIWQFFLYYVIHSRLPKQSNPQ